jgi:hypothetical protein
MENATQLIGQWGDSLFLALDEVIRGAVAFMPKLILAVVIFIVGWLIGAIIGRFVAQVVNLLKVNRALEEVGVGEIVSRAGLKLDAGKFIGKIIEWFIIVVFLLASFELVGLTQVTAFLRGSILTYLPNVISASFILVIAAVVADAMKRTITSSFKAAGITSAHFLGGIAKWAIWSFAVIAALGQLGIAGQYLLTLFTGFVAMLAIAGGLAFGLGGKDAAATFIDRMRDDIGSRR